jgi:protein-disulfide isomerase
MAELLQQDPKVKLVMKDMPILGNASQLESRALLALQRQGGYFKMQAPIMMSAAPSSRDSLRDEANSLGLDGNRMLRDMDDPVIKARLQNNLDLAKQIGIDGTPAFVIGTHLVSGAADLKELQEAIAAVRAGG